MSSEMPRAFGGSLTRTAIAPLPRCGAMVMRFFLIATAGVAALQLPRVAQPAMRRSGSTSMALKLELDPEEASKLLEEGPAASQGPFGKGGALEWVAKGLDDIATVRSPGTSYGYRAVLLSLARSAAAAGFP